MDDSLKIIEQARDKRLKDADVNAAINILEKLEEQIRDDPVLSYDYPNLLKNLAICYMDMAKIEQAREVLEKALPMAQASLNEIEVAEIRAVMARLELQVGAISDAAYYAGQAWDFIGTKKGDRFTPTRATTAEILGEIHQEKEEYLEAIRKFRYALQQAKKVNFTERELTTVLNMVNHYIIRGRMENAENLLKEYMVKAKEYALISADYQLSFAKILQQEGKTQEANKLTLEVLEWARKKGLLRLQAKSTQTI